MKIELCDIRKTYGPVEANAGIHFTIPSGSICGILGENGAGKSTLMKILSGYVRADSGDILLNDRPVRFRHPADALRQGIGMLHQDPLDFPLLTALDNFRLGGSSGDKNILRKWQSDFGFSFDPDSCMETLSVGERQQAEMLRLLERGADVLILDEPATGVTPEQKNGIFNALRLLSTQGKTILLVSHKLEDVERLCDRIIVLRQGRLVGYLTPPYETGEIVRLMFGTPSATSEQRTRVPPGPERFELEDVSIETPRLSLEHVRLSVRQGEIIGLAGVEGGGQTPFLKVCAGCLPTTGGRILFDGHQMDHRSAAHFFRLGIRYIPSGRLEEGLIPGLTLTEHMLLSEPSAPFFVHREKAAQRTQDLIDAFAIHGEPESRVEELSGGNQQRALLALLPQPVRLILAEQPTRGLDIESAAAVWDKLRQRCAEGASVLFSSSDPEEILARADRLLVFASDYIQGPFSTESMTVEELGGLIGGKKRVA